ncbi:MAG: hypothetical protein OXI73_11025 [Rhodospirillales bacterium]|nr:hypothetical protein [Rhodospirillales bacterium]
MHDFDDAFRKCDDAIAAAQYAARREHEAARDDAHLDDDAFFAALNARLDNALPCLAE